MKVLWLNPWFGNYRVPVYEHLKKLTGDNFYLIYGKYSLADSLCKKLDNILGEKAIGIDNSRRIVIGSEKSDMANGCIRIPLPAGVYKVIRKIHPDVIIVDGFFQWAPVAMKYCKLHHIPLIIDYERTSYVERNSPWWRTLYRKIFGKMATGFVVNGSLTIEYLKKLGLGNKIIIPGAMAADSFGLKNAVSAINGHDTQTLKESLNLNSGLTFLFVGQLVERKGVTQLLEAWAIHQETHKHDNLLLIGEGVLKEKLGKVIDTNKLNAHLLGQIPYDDIAKFYAIADVMVMPTLEDNWSLVVPEAMACGLPILCSIYNGGHPELIHNGENGYTFNPLSIESFVKAFSDMHAADLDKMSQISVDIESNYTPDKAAENIMKCCASVTK